MRKAIWRFAPLLLVLVCSVLLLGGCQPTGTVKLKVYRWDSEKGAREETPVEGALVIEDGEVLGKTDAQGTLTLSLEAMQEHVIDVELSEEEYYSKSEYVEPAPGGLVEKEIILYHDEYRTIPEWEYPLRIDEAPDNIVPRNFSSLTLRVFSEAGKQKKLLKLPGFFANFTDLGGEPQELLSLDASMGVLRVVDAADFRSQLPPRGAKPPVFRIGIADLEWENMPTRCEGWGLFFVGDHRLTVQLAAPASCPDLPLEGVAVRIRLNQPEGEKADWPLEIERRTDAAGRVEVPSFPEGEITLTAEKEWKGQVYGGYAFESLGYDCSLQITMQGLAEVTSGEVPHIRLSRGTGEEEEPTVAERAAREELAKATKEKNAAFAPPMLEGAADSVSAYAISPPFERHPWISTRSFTIPKGTKRVLLAFNVWTLEYPMMLWSGKRWNDRWSIQVRGPRGELLFLMDRSVRDQIEGSPRWQPKGPEMGRTGVIEKEISVEDLTTAGPVTLMLSSFSVNIGDGIAPTHVAATLGYYGCWVKGCKAGIRGAVEGRCRLRVSAIEAGIPGEGRVWDMTGSAPQGMPRSDTSRCDDRRPKA